MQAIIADLGCGVKLRGGLAKTMKIGTVGYNAPETESRPYSTSADVFGAGCVLYEAGSMRVQNHLPNLTTR